MLRRLGRRLLAAMVAAAMFGMMAVTFVDVVGRYLLSRPVPGSTELIQVLMALAVAAALPLVTAGGEHITMDLFSGLFRGAARRALDALVMAFSSAVLAFLALRVWDQALNLHRSRMSTIFLDLPIAPVAFTLSALIGVACLVQVALLVAHLRGNAGGARAQP